MNDNDQSNYDDPRSIHNDDPPQWVWDIIDKHNLAEKADCPFHAAAALLTDAAILLKEASQTAFREQAFSAETKRQIVECETMIADAEKLFPLCPAQPIDK